MIKIDCDTFSKLKYGSDFPEVVSKNLTGKELDAFLSSKYKYYGKKYSIDLPSTSKYLDFDTILKNNQSETPLSENNVCDVQNKYCIQKDYNTKNAEMCNDCKTIVKNVNGNVLNTLKEIIDYGDKRCVAYNEFSTSKAVTDKNNTDYQALIKANNTKIKDFTDQLYKQYGILQEQSDKIDYLNSQLSTLDIQTDNDTVKKYVGFVYANLGFDITNKTYFYSMLSIDTILFVILIYLIFKK